VSSERGRLASDFFRVDRHVSDVSVKHAVTDFPPLAFLALEVRLAIFRFTLELHAAVFAFPSVTGQPAKVDNRVEFPFAQGNDLHAHLLLAGLSGVLALNLKIGASVFFSGHSLPASRQQRRRSEGQSQRQKSLHELRLLSKGINYFLRERELSLGVNRASSVTRSVSEGEGRSVFCPRLRVGLPVVRLPKPSVLVPGLKFQNTVNGAES
jgi:hypothetical protein